MTRKDYVMLAAALNTARADIISKEPAICRRDMLDGVSYAVDWIADALAQDNRRFDKRRFKEAAEGRVEEITLETKP